MKSMLSPMMVPKKYSEEEEGDGGEGKDDGEGHDME